MDVILLTDCLKLRKKVKSEENEKIRSKREIILLRIFSDSDEIGHVKFR